MLRQARCDVVVELIDEEECPDGFEEEPPGLQEYTDDQGNDRTRIACALPKWSAPRDCAQMEAQPNQQGWYYCENAVEAVEESPDLCRYEVQLTEPTKELIRGSAVSIQCMQQFSFEDDNCREDSVEICSDGVDNDGNGVFDCFTKKDGDDAHFAEPACCPMTMGEGKVCIIDEEAYGICVGSSPSQPSDSCRAAADLLGCTIPQ